MLIKLNDSWWCDASLISAVVARDNAIFVCFFKGEGSKVADGEDPAEVKRIAKAVNAARCANVAAEKGDD